MLRRVFVHILSDSFRVIFSAPVFLCFSLKSRRTRGGERKKREHGGLLPLHQQKWHKLRQKVKHMILQPGKPEGVCAVQQNLFYPK